MREADPDARAQLESDLRRRFRFLAWAPLLVGSAVKPQLVHDLLPEIDRVMKGFSKRVTTGLLNKFLQEVLERQPLPVRKEKPSRATKSVFMTQVTTKPPTFAMFVSRPDDIDSHYLRFLEKQLREQFEFYGTPLRILVRPK